MAGRREVELVGAYALSQTVRLLQLRCVDAAPLRFVAGQWINLYVPTDQGVLRRAYSIASPPDGARFELGVTAVEGGAASTVLHSLAPGERLEIDGPHGFFTRQGHETEPALFVGTGSGLCPLRAMLSSELHAASGPELALLFGCRAQADILWRTELEAWALQHERFSLHVTLSRPDDDWHGLRGYVQTHLRALLDNGRRPHVYVCGVSKMVKEVRAVLKQELGYDRKWIHTERYD